MLRSPQCSTIKGLALLLHVASWPALPCNAPVRQLTISDMGLKPLSVTAALVAVAVQPWLATAAVGLELNVTAQTPGLIASDGTAVYYSDEKPLLISNDGGASTGGYHVWDLSSGSPLEELSNLVTGRTKLVATLYDIAGKDYMVSIPQTTSVFSLYELPDFTEIKEARFSALGDWSALCAWRSPAANTYLYLFGKRDATQYLVREMDGTPEFVEIQTFETPVEFSGCAVSHTHGKMFLTPDDGDELYSFDLAESTAAPEIATFGKGDDTLTGVAVYNSNNKTDYLFVALSDKIAVYEYPFQLIGTLEMTGLDEIEIEALSMYQASTSRYPAGVLAYAAEADDFEGFALSSLEGILEELGITANTEYHPASQIGCRKRTTITSQCSDQGFFDKKSGDCDCFAGSTGKECADITCIDDCSGHGTCVGPNQCKCEKQWGGLHCSFLLVEPEFETDANGNDGDDPAIWISPVSPELSRIVTTTKSEEGSGLGVFDLSGNLLQIFPGNQPNNVDIIYAFQAGNRTVDLTFAACRGDNTLCIFEMTPDGVLKDIPGGISPSYAEDEVYGSCVYRSEKTGKQFLFVNEKSARYMQYELTASANGTLQTELVREFVGGSGGQVEGCVTDSSNGWLILGEEPSALWRYDAEPDGSTEGYRIAYVGDGKTWGDVEGVTLAEGPTKDQGFIFVSMQGVSAYNVYRRAHPHEYIMTFTLTSSADGKIDHVTNTDGLTVVPNNLGPLFPNGLLVVHDDTNELPEGGADEEASYKLVGLDYILGAEPFKHLNLLDELDPNWNPRDHPEIPGDGGETCEDV